MHRVFFTTQTEGNTTGKSKHRYETGHDGIKDSNGNTQLGQGRKESEDNDRPPRKRTQKARGVEFGALNGSFDQIAEEITNHNGRQHYKDRTNHIPTDKGRDIP
jgi:hypothetical protein